MFVPIKKRACLGSGLAGGWDFRWHSSLGVLADARVHDPLSWPFAYDAFNCATS
jgi:hypothetical protein